MKQVIIALIAACGFASAAHAQYPAGLAAYWQFNESSGNIAIDSVGTNTGIITGSVTRIVGATGQGNALQFNNAGGDGVNVGTSLLATNGIAVEALIRPQWNGTDYDEIFRKEDGSDRILFSFQNDGGAFSFPATTGPVLSFGLHIAGNVYQELDMPLDGLAGRPTLSSLVDGGWHQVVAMYDAATGVKSLAVDGTIRYSVGYTPGSLIQSGGISVATIGNLPGGGEPFSGGIDEVAFYGRALTASEIKQHNDNRNTGQNYFAATVPEAGSLALLALPLVGMAIYRRRTA